MPISFSIAYTVFGPPAGMMPSGRNWPLSVVRPAMYCALLIVLFCTYS